jgi:hypothetical protein
MLLSPGQQRLLAAHRTGINASEVLPGGEWSKQVQKVTFNDGTVGVIKEAHEHDQAAKEVAADHVLRALGIANVHTVQIGAAATLSDFVDGPTGYDIDDEISRRARLTDSTFMEQAAGTYGRLMQAPGAKETAVLDWLITNRDRHEGNWIYHQGTIVPIDHGNAKFNRPLEYHRDTPYVTQSVFSEYWLGLQRGERRHLDPRMTRGYVASLMPRLQAIRPLFAGRREWHDAIMARYEQLLDAVS